MFVSSVSPVAPIAYSYYVYAPAISAVAFNICAFIVAQILHDNSIVDIIWGFLLVVPNLVALLCHNHWYPRQILVLTIVCIWAFRLAIHIGIRHNGEDFRYQDMRRGWEAKGSFNYYMSAFWIVFIMQAIFSLAVNSSALFVSIWSCDNLFVLDIIGTLIWIFGFIFELVADWQLQQFRNDASNRGKIMKTGLWRYSRHPNYFGEAVTWWGISLISCSVQYGWITIYSALVITILVRYVSGVPLLEKKYETRKEFQEYCNETNVFIPWFVSKSNESREIMVPSQ